MRGSVRVLFIILSEALLVALTSPSIADYAWVEPQSIQWRWMEAPDDWVIRGLALRPHSSGTFLLSSFAPPPAGDGYLHLIPPSGGKAGISTRFGPRLNFSSVAVLDEAVYAVADAVDPESEKVPLYKVDYETGGVIRLVEWVDQQARYFLTTDRFEDVLVLPEQVRDGADEWRIVAFDPETAEKETRATIANRGAPIAATRGRDRNIVVVTDEQYVTEPDSGDPAAFPVRRRIGGASFGDFAVYYADGRACEFFNKSLFTTIDGRVWTYDSNTDIGTGARRYKLVARPSEDSTYEPPYTMPIADTEAGGYFVNAMRNEAIIFGCPFPSEGDDVPEGAIPPPSGALKDNPPASRPPPPKIAARIAAPPAAGPPAAHAPVQAAAPKAIAQAVTPQVTYQAGTQAAAQTSAAPNAVGLADSTEDDAALSFSASGRRREFSASWTRLAFGALATTAMAAVAFLLAIPDQISVALANTKRRDRNE